MCNTASYLIMYEYIIKSYWVVTRKLVGSLTLQMRKHIPLNIVICTAAWCCFSDGSNLHSHCSENIIFHIFKIVLLYVNVVFVQFLQVNPTLFCTNTKLVITYVTLHWTAWWLEPDSFVYQLAPHGHVHANWKLWRSVPNVTGHYQTFHGTAETL